MLHLQTVATLIKNVRSLLMEVLTVSLRVRLANAQTAKQWAGISGLPQAPVAVLIPPQRVVHIIDESICLHLGN